MAHKEFRQGIYKPINALKYVGNKLPVYRSGYELKFMRWADANPNVLKWGSETVRIPYLSPIDGKLHSYSPDCIVMYRDGSGEVKAEMVEIKPKKQSLIESRVTSAKDRAIVALNHAKWAAAMAWCKNQGLTFRVITEDDLFYNGSRSK